MAKGTRQPQPIKNPRDVKIPLPYARFFTPRPRNLLAAPAKLGVISYDCSLLKDAADEYLAEHCAMKTNEVTSFDNPCLPAGQAPAQRSVDLVGLIDTSGSMEDEANALSAAVQSTIQAVGRQCRADLRVKWFGLEGIFNGTVFNESLRNYLLAHGVTAAQITHQSNEDGGAAIADTCNHFDWRPGAEKLILFLGDEPLYEGEPQTAEDVAAANTAISAALAKTARVYTYAGTGLETYVDSATGVRAVDEFARVATATGGLAYSYETGDLAQFSAILEQTVCHAPAETCQTVQVPNIRPCLTIRWGDGPNDRIETDDVETICVTASNPYANVWIRDLTAYILVAPTDTLPDGTKSIELTPQFQICFGDLAPCGMEGSRSSVSRPMSLVTRGARPGPFVIAIAHCYKVEFHLASGDRFLLDLVAS
jgi:hypothetical protein